MQKIQVALGDLQSQLEAVRDITGKLQTENEQKTLLMQVDGWLSRLIVSKTDQFCRQYLIHQLALLT